MTIKPWEAEDLATASKLLAKRAAFCRRLRAIKEAGIGDTLSELGGKALGGFQELHAANPLLTTSLTGAGLGAAAGGLSSALSPRKERRQPLTDAITGALAGGAAGLGGQLLYDNAPALQNAMKQMGAVKGLEGGIKEQQGLIPSLLNPASGDAVTKGLTEKPGLGEALQDKALQVPTGDLLRKIPIVGKPLGSLSDMGRHAYGSLFGSAAGQAGSVTVPIQAGLLGKQLGTDLYHKMTPTSGANLQEGAGALLGDKKNLLQSLSSLVKNDAVNYAKPRTIFNPENLGDVASKSREALAKAREAELTKALASLQTASGRKGIAAATRNLTGIVEDANAPGLLKQIGQTGQNVRAGNSFGRWAQRVRGHAGWALGPALLGLAADPQAAARRAAQYMESR